MIIHAVKKSMYIRKHKIEWIVKMTWKNAMHLYLKQGFIQVLLLS